MTTVMDAALARGWRIEYDDDENSAEFPFAWFKPNGDLHDCYRFANDLPLVDIAAVEKGERTDG